MKELFYDLVENWKHGLSSDNTKGSRGWLWFIFIACILLTIGGVGLLVLFAISHKIFALIFAIVGLVAGIGIFVYVSTR